ncbi:MAG: polysaccharide biosynthesis C-terminal domain-containing protein [Halioglobus sp.]|nr:polysaccharide biosynthesis C-terminal domain-containing protein [Halioglobus sp.]
MYTEFLKFLKSSLFVVSALKVASIPASFLLTVLLARTLGTHEYGVYVFTLSVITIASIPIDTGLRQYIAREVRVHSYGGEWGKVDLFLKRIAFLVFAVLSAFVLTSAMACLVYPSILNSLAAGVLLLAGSICLVRSLNGLRVSTLRGLGYISQSQIPELLFIPAFQLTILFFVSKLFEINHLGALSILLLALTLGYLIGTQIIKKYRYIYLHKSFFSLPDRKMLTAWLSFSLISGVGVFSNQAGTIIVGVLSDADQVAALKVAESTSQLVALPFFIANILIAPVFAKYLVHQDKQVIFEQYNRARLWIFLVSISIFVIILLTASDLVGYVFGEEYSKIATFPVVLMCSAQLLRSAFGPVGALLSMTGHEKYALRSLCIGLFLNIIVCVVFVPTFGATAAAIAYLLCTLTWNGLMLVACRKTFGLEKRHSL